MKKTRNLSFIVVLLGCVLSYAQQESQYTQYIYNPSYLNPGYAGSRTTTNLYLQSRDQWRGFEGAPKSTFINFQGYSEDKNLGFGINFHSNTLAILKESSLTIDLAYHLKLSETSSLGLGVKGSANNLNVDFNQLNLLTSTDPYLSESIENRFSPNFGVGFYYYTEISYLGISIPNMLNTYFYDIQSSNSFSADVGNLHWYLMGGYIYDISSELRFKPAFLLRKSSSSTITDFSANFLYRNRLNLGVSYRNKISISALMGFQINNMFFAGYNYEIDTTKIGFNSHELFLRFEIFNEKIYRKIQSPRFF